LFSFCFRYVKRQNENICAGGTALASYSLQEQAIKEAAMNMGTGIAIGIAIGAGIGVAIDNVAMGIGIGIAIGAGLGAVFLAASDSSKKD
jgi:hypothetical protein